MSNRLVLILLVLFGGAVQAADWEYVIRAHGVGHVNVGMTAAEVAKRLPANRIKKWSPYANISVIDVFVSAEQKGEATLRLNLDRNERVWGIEVNDRRYKTSKGITRGATFGALRKAHPNIVIGTQAGEMDRYIQAEIPGEGIHFYFKFDQDLWNRMQNQPDPNNASPTLIPDSTPIQDVFIS